MNYNHAFVKVVLSSKGGKFSSTLAGNKNKNVNRPLS